MEPVSTFLRESAKFGWDKTQPLAFQITEVSSGDEPAATEADLFEDFDEDESDDGSVVSFGSNNGGDSDDDDDNPAPPAASKKSKLKPYIITLFGVTAEGQSVSLRISGYRPAFYIELPKGSTAKTVTEISGVLCKGLTPEVKQQLKIQVCGKGRLYGYTNRSKYQFLRIEVPNTWVYSRLRKTLMTKRCFMKSHRLPSLGTSSVKLQVYETNIDPLLRFFHVRDLNAAGWVQVSARHYEQSPRATVCQLAFQCDWQAVHPLRDRFDVAPLTKASWDIECTSSHGDFPLAKKSYEKVASDIDGLIKEDMAIIAGRMAVLAKGTSGGREADLKTIEDARLRVTKHVKDCVLEALWPETYTSSFTRKWQAHKLAEQEEGYSGTIAPANKPITSVILKEPHAATDLLPKYAAIPAVRNGAGVTIRAAVTKYSDLVHYRLSDGPSSEILFNKKEKRLELLAQYIHSRVGGELPLEGDAIIQIGTCLQRMDATGKPSTSEKHIFTLNTCDPIPGSFVYPCKTEAEMLIKWGKFIRDVDPDVMLGYNTACFDEKYVYERAQETGSWGGTGELSYLLGRFPGKQSELQKKELSSAAMGQNIMYMITMPGRLRIDLFQYVKRNFPLDSFKLDSVSATFMCSDVSDCDTLLSGGMVGKLKPGIPCEPGTSVKLKCKSTEGIRVGQFVTLKDSNNEPIDHKFRVSEVSDKYIVCAWDFPEAVDGAPTSWSQAKDDIHPKDIFRLQKGSSADRAIIGKYCIQDCNLVLDLESKLRTYINAMSMANVCSVPISFIFNRGQGVKIESLVFKECAKRNILIKVMPSPKRNEIVPDIGGGGDNPQAVDNSEDEDDDDDEDDSGYEGAIVLNPLMGFYGDDPVVVLDYASLYPSSMMSENISQDALTHVRDYDLTGRWVNEFIRDALGKDIIDSYGKKTPDPESHNDEFDNIPGVRYIDIDFDILKPDPDDMFTRGGKAKKHPRQIKTGTRICRYAQYPKGERATMGEILQMLLGTRKATRELQKKEEKYSFRWTLLEMLQLAYKTTANSLYGQLGSATSKIRCVPLAASTTAYGRKQIMYSKAVIEEIWGKAANHPDAAAVCVYGDTDSLFIAFYPKDKDGKTMTGWPAVLRSEELANETGHLISTTLKSPQDFEFDKIFWPMVLLSKKRYLGHMYEEPSHGIDSYVVKSMGIALKRRDNAPIVKDIYGGAGNAILKNRSITAACDFIKTRLHEMATGKVPLRKLTITKALRGSYNTPNPPAHAVLAERIGQRDPGNRPQSGDRITFAYVLPPRPDMPIPATQGDRIETPQYIMDSGLKLDYTHYITKQILRPVGQFMAVMLENIPGFARLGRSPTYYKTIEAKETDRQMFVNGRVDDAKVHKKVEEARMADVCKLLFADSLRVALHAAKGLQDITTFFGGPKPTETKIATVAAPPQPIVGVLPGPTPMIKHVGQKAIIRRRIPAPQPSVTTQS